MLVAAEQATTGKVRLVLPPTVESALDLKGSDTPVTVPGDGRSVSFAAVRGQTEYTRTLN